MLKLPKLEVVKETAKNSFEQEVQAKYEELIQFFSVELAKTYKMGYIGWSETFCHINAATRAALERCKKQICKEGYRCNIDWEAYNPKTKKNDGKRVQRTTYYRYPR